MFQRGGCWRSRLARQEGMTIEHGTNSSMNLAIKKSRSARQQGMTQEKPSTRRNDMTRMYENIVDITRSLIPTNGCCLGRVRFLPFPAKQFQCHFGHQRAGKDESQADVNRVISIHVHCTSDECSRVGHDPRGCGLPIRHNERLLLREC